MALTRSLLKGMGLTDEQVSSIIEAHTETVDGLKAERDRYKEQAAKLDDVQKELDKVKGGENWKDKYEAERKAFADYKTEVSNKETLREVKAAYRKLLTANNVGESHIDSILKVTDFGSMKLNADGKLENEAAAVEAIKKDWGGFITTTQTKGADVATPPAGSGKALSREQIYAKDEHGRYKLDAAQRQEQLAQLMQAEQS